MTLTLFGNSGKAAVIELEKELEVSATKAALVTVELVIEAKAKTAIEVLVNKEVVQTVLPGEAPAASKESVTVEVAAAQKYEVKNAAGLKEALASVALEQNQITPAAITTLRTEAKTEAETASVKANEELREKNAKILSLTSK